MTHAVDMRVEKSSTVWMSASMMVLQTNLIARKEAVSSWVFRERPELACNRNLVNKKTFNTLKTCKFQD